jgi:hypothetical protein
MKQNRNLNPVELQQANSVLGEVRTRLNALAAGDLELLFALRRKVYKELTYDERGKPAERKTIEAPEICRAGRQLCYLRQINAFRIFRA